MVEAERKCSVSRPVMELSIEHNLCRRVGRVKELVMEPESH